MPPPPVNLPDIYRMLKPGEATKREATPQVAALIQTLRLLGERGRIAEEGKEAVKFEIGEFVLSAETIEKPAAKDKGKHVITIDGKPALTIAYQETDRIDADKLRLDFPQAAAECTKTSSYFKFDLKRSKP